MIITVKGAHELRRAAEALRRSKGTVRRELTAAFRQAGDATLREIRRNVETMTMTGYAVSGRHKPFTASRPGTDIRRRISRVTELDISTSAGDPRVRFVVRVDRLGNAAKLPAYFDKGEKFRHPVIGNRKVWAGQKGQPWFRKTVLAGIKTFRAECDEALDRAVTTIRREM